MKKTLMALIIISVLSISAIPQVKSDWERDVLYGRVQHVRIETLYLDEKGNPISKEGRALSSITSYDVSGNKIEDEGFANHGKLSGGKYTSRYDAQGNLIESIHHGAFPVKTVYLYDGQENPSDGDEVNWVNRINRDAQGRTKEIIYSAGDGLVINRQVFVYDSTGRVVEVSTYNRQGSFAGQEIKTYNDAGRLISKVNGKKSGDRDYKKVTYSYDGRGNMIEEKEFNNRGLEAKTSNKYEFDSASNWIKETAKYWRRGKDSYTVITYRIITYY